MAVPLARCLNLLESFDPVDGELGNSELTRKSGLPASTVARLASALVTLGYLNYDQHTRLYRLAAPVLSLGYAAIAHSQLQRLARKPMEAFADNFKVDACLATRDRLDLMVLESRSGATSPAPQSVQVGMRVGIAGSPLGWALLAALPEMERAYLLESLERRLPREWPRARRRASEGIAQVQQRGFCATLGESMELAVIAAPLIVEGREPLVLACIGAGPRMTRARVERELGPSLVAVALAVQSGIGDE